MTSDNVTGMRGGPYYQYMTLAHLIVYTVYSFILVYISNHNCLFLLLYYFAMCIYLIMCIALSLQVSISLYRLHPVSRARDKLWLEDRLDQHYLAIIEVNFLKCENTIYIMILTLKLINSVVSAWFIFTVTGWTVPGGTAIPGRCVEWTEWAPIPSPCSKNQFNIWSPDRGHIRY